MSELFYWQPAAINPREIETDVCIYGGNAAGVVAALQLAREGKRSVIVEPNAHLGGLSAGGLSCTDFGNKRAIGGISLEFYQAMGAHYGVDAEWDFEPKVAEAQFNKWLAESGAQAYFREFVASVDMHGKRIGSLTTESGLTVHATYFLDCSYEGDLLAKAGCSYHVGREGNDVHGETLNGVQCRDKHQFQQPVSPYVVDGDANSGLLAGIDAEGAVPDGTGDKRVQAYNFRMCLTQKADNQIPFSKPENYDASAYELLGRYMLVGGASEIRGKYDKLRGDKVDKNNHGGMSTDFIGANHGFPEANNATREKIFQAHVAWHRGLFWFLQTDERVPSADREWVASWGLAKDEFPQTGGWPHQLYIRESRRLIADYVSTEADCTYQRKCDDPVGLAAYTMDSHNCRRFVRDGRVLNEGDVQVHVGGPYGISWRSLIPKLGECENLIVPVCLSASHIAYGSIRMEPVFMTMGQTAASAASLALDSGKPAVQALDYALLRARLEKDGQVLEWTKTAEA